MRQRRLFSTVRQNGRMLVTLCLTVLLATALPVEARRRNSAPPFVLVIDAGHGGRDLGASGRRSHEKELTLKIAKRLSKRVKSCCKGVEVILTRTDDEYLSLEDRAGMANFFRADLFLSIHVNSAPTKTRGTETFIHRSNPSNSRSEHFARLIERAYTERGGRNSRGVKRANFVVLRETNMPGVLTEVGFISDAQEEKFIQSRRGRNKLAECLLDAFTAYRDTYAPTP